MSWILSASLPITYNIIHLNEVPTPLREPPRNCEPISSVVNIDGSIYRHLVYISFLGELRITVSGGQKTPVRAQIDGLAGAVVSTLRFALGFSLVCRGHCRALRVPTASPAVRCQFISTCQQPQAVRGNSSRRRQLGVGHCLFRECSQLRHRQRTDSRCPPGFDARAASNYSVGWPMGCGSHAVQEAVAAVASFGSSSLLACARRLP